LWWRHQVGHVDFFALVEPVDFQIGQGAAQEIAGAVKAQNRQTALFGAAARRGKMFKQLFFAQNGINRPRQGSAFARPKAPVVAKEFRDNRVSGVIKFEGEPDEFGTDVE
jgi:hypothetical protein